MTLLPFPSKLLSQHFSEQLMCRAGLCNLGSLEVVTPPSPSLQVAGGAPQAPASTTACVRTASVATPAPVLRATRERTVLSVRHGPLLRSPCLLLSQGDPVKAHSAPPRCHLPWFWLKHTAPGRAGVMCAACLQNVMASWGSAGCPCALSLPSLGMQNQTTSWVHPKASPATATCAAWLLVLLWSQGCG